MPLLPEQTVPYKTWIKTSLVEGLRQVFAQHPDIRIRTRDGVRDGKPIKLGTKVSIDFPTSELHYPTIVVRFQERDISNIGVGHVEYILVDSDDVVKTKFRHYLYHGMIEFAIYALSSLDRDLISDSLVQALAMPDMANYTEDFWQRIYFPVDEGTTDAERTRSKGRWNYVNLNLDRITGSGENQTPQPWLSEDQLVYQTSYRTDIMGEFYSLPPVDQVAVGNVERVVIYTYDEGQEPPDGSTEGYSIPPNTWEASSDDPSPWL
jgi:hypothetical protein